MLIPDEKIGIDALRLEPGCPLQKVVEILLVVDFLLGLFQVQGELVEPIVFHDQKMIIHGPVDGGVAGVRGHRLPAL